MVASVNSLNCQAKGVDERLRAIAACPNGGADRLERAGNHACRRFKAGGSGGEIS